MILKELKNPPEIRQFKNTWTDVNTDFANKPADTFQFSTMAGKTRWGVDAAEKLGKYGFKTAGSGLFGAVFINPQYPYALKVFKNDSAYESWVIESNRHKHNIFFPRFRGKLLKINQVYNAVRIEKLKPMSSKTFEWIEALLDVAKENRNASPKKFSDDIGETIFRTLQHKDHRLVRLDEQAKLALEIIGDSEESIEMFIEMCKVLHRSEFELDFHSGNMMIRDDGTPVMTDPLFDSRS